MLPHKKRIKKTIMQKTSRAVVIGILITVAYAFGACNRLPIYSHYEHAPSAGWEKNDTLDFYVTPVKEAGYYHEELGLRIDDSYPFQGLCLVIEQTILPSGYRHNDTLNCSLYEKNGVAKGSGIKHYQYNFHMNTIRLNEGDSLHIAVRHNMKREIMPGITDIGLLIRKQ